MVKPIILLFAVSLSFLFFDSGKKSSPTIQTGRYEATTGSFFDKAKWYLKGKRGIVINTSLELKDDNQYTYKACGCQSTGIWSYHNDTVYLQEQQHIFRDPKKEKSLKKCVSTNYLLENKRLYKLKYAHSKSIECLAIKGN